MCGCAAKMKYFKGKYLHHSTMLYVGTSSHCQITFPFIFVVTEKGTGDIANIDWYSDTLAL